MNHTITLYKKTFRYCLLLVVSMFTLMFTASAQDSRGTEFWICFPGNQQSPSPELYITGPQASDVTVEVPGIGFSQTVSISAGGLQVITLPGDVQVQTQFVNTNLGIHITATNPVTVYGMNAQQATTDAYLAFPLDAIGTEYYVLAYSRDFSFELPTQTTIVATQNNTTVTVTSSVTGGPFTAGIPATITLQQGEVYQMRSLLTGADYTSTKITADKPISVFGGAQCTNISGSFRACDHLVEQLPPLSSWGKSFLTVPLATRLAGDVFRFLAQRNGTQVSVNGALVATLNAGQFYETVLNSGTYNRITSTEPVLVGQYSRSSDVDGVVSDPFFALVPPDEQFLNSYVVSAGTANIISNYLNITSPTANIGSVTVDGVVVAPGVWQPIQSTGFSGATIAVANGVHTVNSNLPVGLLIYGFGTYDSYGYLGGQSFAPVATVNNLVLAPKGATSPVNVERCFTATVKDQFGTPVVGVRVDFNVTGPNAAGSGFANTDASGVATYCYTGTVDGTDNITAAVGTTTDATTFVWTPLPTCSASATADGPVSFCQGGSVTLSASAGASYLWSNGATTKDITVNESGIYTVIVTDANSCSSTSDPITVTVFELPAKPSIGVSGATTFCAGNSVTLSSSAAASYLWSTDATTQEIVVTASGSYAVTIKDNNGCTATSDPVEVLVNPRPDVPVITASGPTTFCAGGSVTLTSSAADGNLWSNGATTQSITVSAAGFYSVTVSNSDGCNARSAAVSVVVNNCNGNYCSANGTSCVKGFIKNVFACYGFNNTTGYTGYGDYTAKTVTSGPGKLLGFAVTPGYPVTATTYPPMYIKAWIDWNADGDFDDAGETVFAPSIPISVRTKFWVRVPLGTTPGNKRMRVALRSDRSPQACGTFTYGEVEDYTVVIGSARGVVAPDATEDAFLDAGDVFTIYPNPARNRMVIERSGFDDSRAAAAPVQMILTGTDGKVLMQAKMISLVQAFDVSRLAAGVYYVTIISSNSKVTQKVIVSR